MSQSLETKVTTLEAHAEETERRVCKIEGRVFGNGKPGLSDEVLEMKTTLRNIHTLVKWLIPAMLASPILYNIISVLLTSKLPC